MTYRAKLNGLNRFAVGILIISIGSVVSLFAQSAGRGGVPGNSSSGPFAEAMERRNREAALRSLQMGPRSGETNEQIDPAVLEQLNEDFKRIQIVRLRMIQDIKKGKPFRYERLAGDASEIRKRAGRIKQFLSTEKNRSGTEPAPGGTVYNGTAIQEAAAEMCLEISRFIENPIFSSQGVYKARDAAEAAQTLDLVIQLSSDIKNSAEMLRKQK
jgi:hypothetical protein